MLGMIRRLKPTSFADFYLLFLAFTIPVQTIQILRAAITPFHVINLVLFGAGLFLLRGKKLRWPFAIPALLYLLGSIFGMFSSEVLGINFYHLGLDIYLYVWFAAMCVVMSSTRRVEYLVTAWALAVLLVLASEGTPGWLGGATRLEFSFRNPNRAASYFGLSFFFLFHPVIPRIYKVVLAVALLLAVSATGSVAGLLMLPVGCVVFAWAWSYVRAGQALRPLQHLGWAVVALGLVYASTWAEADKATTLVSALSPRGGPRMEEGTSDRQEIWAQGLKTFKEHPLGIGPASFRWQIEIETRGGEQKGMHSDFVASLVERGVLGLLGFVLLLGAVALRIMKMLRLSARSRDRTAGFWGAALAGAFAGYIFYAITHEMLHHETFWLLLALIVSQVSILERERMAAVIRVVPQTVSAVPRFGAHRRRLRVG